MTDLEPLRAFLREMPATDAVIAEWRGGPQQDGSFQSPYPHYEPVIDRLWAGFAAAGLPAIEQGKYVDYISAMNQWRAARGIERVRAEHVGLMDRETCLYFLREIERSERFCDGAWLGAWRDGLFHALAARLIALNDAG